MGTRQRSDKMHEVYRIQWGRELDMQNALDGRIEKTRVAALDFAANEGEDVIPTVVGTTATEDELVVIVEYNFIVTTKQKEK